MSAEIRKLNKISNSSIMTLDEIERMRKDIKVGFEKVEKATLSLDKTRKIEEPGSWKKVEAFSEQEKFPLVQSDIDQMVKRLNII